MKSNNLIENIRQWLSKQGLHLEMKVAKKFSDNNFEVRPSSMYEDPITNIGREIDIISSKGILLNKNIIFDITFVIECKYSKDKPWVLFKSSRQDYYGKNYNFMFRNSSEHAKIILLELENFDNELKENFLFSFNDNLYYGAKRAHLNQDHMINEAINQVCNANHARSLKIDSYNNTHISNLEIQFPIIVVDGKLFESYLNNKLEIILNEINYGHLLISRPELGNQKFFIDIVSFNYLDEYINSISNATEEILNYSDKLETTKEFIINKNRT